MNMLSIFLLNVDNNAVRRLRQTTALDTYQGATKNFHEDGLYSTVTFGEIGSTHRDTNFSYIDVRIPLVSPAIILALFELKRLYKDILSGKRYGIWVVKDNDFEPADPLDKGAGTGYAFFMDHWNDLKPKKTDSTLRNETVELFERFKDIANSRYTLVLPAGLRDLEVDDFGGDKEDEVTPLYRKLLSTARMIPLNVDDNDPIYDTMRWQLQDTFIQIYMNFFDHLDGKKGYTRGKWTSRGIVNGTRNVISSMDPASPVMGRADSIKPTDTKIGLFQGLKALLPIAVYCIRTRLLDGLDGGAGKLWLIDKRSMTRTLVQVNSEQYDLLLTDEGIEKIINNFRYSDSRNAPYTIADHYVALIYSDDKVFKVFHDISELPDGFKRGNVTGITYTELLYLSGYDRWNNYFSTMTRYPIAGPGSTYPSTIRLTTTTRVRVLYELGADWLTKAEKPAIDYPDKTDSTFINSLYPYPGRVKPAQGDFDGDMESADATYTDESLTENNHAMKQVKYWFNINGQPVMEIDTEVIKRTLVSLLGEPD